MSALPGPWNPITYAQFYVAGGWRVSVMVVGGYAALLGGGIYLSAAHDPRAADVLEAWAHGLLVLQAVILFGYGAFRVNAAVRSDLASRMIESHRLMPMRPAAAVAGYVLGAPAVPVVLFGVTAAIGAVCVGGSGGRVRPDQWWVANGMVAAAGVCAWAVVAQFAFAARGGFVLLLVGTLVAAGVAVTPQGLSVVPAVNVLTVPLLGRSVVALQRGLVSSDTMAVSLATQAAVTAVCLRAAVRRYRSDTAAGFSPVLGLLLVGTWVAASVVALRWPGWFDNRLYWRREQAVAASYATSVGGGLLLAAVPVASAARAVAGPGGLVRRIGPLVLTAAVAAAAVAAVAGVSPREVPVYGYVMGGSSGGPTRASTGGQPTVTPAPAAAATAAASVAAWVVGTAGLFAVLSTARRRAWAAVVLWIGTTWIGPVVIDQIYQTLTSPHYDGPTWLSAVSPVAAVDMAYEVALGRARVPDHVAAGLAGQAAIAATMVAAAALTAAVRRGPAAAN